MAVTRTATARAARPARRDRLRSTLERGGIEASGERGRARGIGAVAAAGVSGSAGLGVSGVG